MKSILFSSELLFSVFYIISFALASILVLYVGIRRKYDLRSLLLTVLFVSLFSVIGSRLLTIPVSEWVHIPSTDLSYAFGGRSALGALIFGLIALIISHRIFSYKKPLYDIYAWTVPFGLGIQKIGCFFVGCCFGKPTDLFLGVNYPKGTPAHFQHFADQLIPLDGLTSLSVHPVQLYETVFLVGIAVFIFKTRHWWKRNASVLLFSLLLFAGFRFAIEFIRDPGSSQFNESILWGIRSLQWILLAILAGILALLIFNERNKNRAVQYKKYRKITVATYISSLVFITCLLYTFHELFSRFEFIVIMFILLPTTIIIVYIELKNNHLRKYSFFVLSILFIPFILISQQEDSRNKQQEKYKKVSLGMHLGSIKNDATHYYSNDCGSGVITNDAYEYQYSLFGGGFSWVDKTRKRTFEYGINLYAGNHRIDNFSGSWSESDAMFGLNPFGTIDMKWVGFGLGVHLGDLKWMEDHISHSTNLSEATKNETILPEYFIRVGVRKALDLKYSRGFGFISPYPIQTNTFSVGSGLGIDNFSLRFGAMTEPQAEFISAEGLINPKLGFKAMYVLSSTDFEHYDAKSHFRLGVALNYRFDFK